MTASSGVVSRIQALEGPSTAQQNKASEYQQLLHDIVATSDASHLVADLAAFTDSILGDSIGIVAARPLLGSYVETLRKLESPDVKVESGRYALQALESRVVSFEEQDASIREILADAYQEQEEYIEAARMLQGIQLESTQRKVSEDAKVRTWIRICRLYLEEDDTTSAESYLNRAKNLLYKVEDRELKLKFLLSQARILDSRRRFLDACQAYHAFSMSSILAEEDRTIALSKATICAVLAPAGPQRSRALGKLFKDERAVQLEEFGMLEKMFLNRLISPQEVAKFADKLSPHQLAQTSDGSTVLAKAVIEHNLLGASRLYSNMGIAELGMLLGLGADKTEEVASRMLEQSRLLGRIDQIDGVIYFDGQEGSAQKLAAQRIGSRNLRKWDSNVQGLAENVESVASLLQSQFPVFNPLVYSGAR